MPGRNLRLECGVSDSKFCSTVSQAIRIVNIIYSGEQINKEVGNQIKQNELPASQIFFNFEQSLQVKATNAAQQMQYVSQSQRVAHSPGEEDFEEQIAVENTGPGFQGGRRYENNNMSRDAYNLRSSKIFNNHEVLTSNEGSPESVSSKGKVENKLHDDVTLRKDAYNIVYKYYPPNPILPKSFQVHEESPRSGGEYAFLKLIKFRGRDAGKSKLEKEYGVNYQLEFPDGTTLKNIFLPSNPETDEKQTLHGEVVYLRSALDFTSKTKEPGTKKDEILEENLIDVRKILKNCAQNKNLEPNQNMKETGSGLRKGLVQLHGVEQFYKKKDQYDKTLIFESRFESGNLAAALKVNESEYHLLLQNDVNTSGHTQWFFYRVTSTRKFQEVRFNMMNLSKPDSLFNEGMKVLIYSEKQSEDKDIGWYRGGTKISYYQNGIRKDAKKAKSYYTLTFSYEFLYDDDIVYFAYCYPYTYTDMLEDLNKISNDPIKSQFCARKTLCMSVAENKLEMLTITSRQNLETLNKRKGVFLTARVHPGESVGSWMMKGAIDFLTDETSEEAEILRQNFVFKIIPMLNPDGVVNGNYRCSLAGCDLNRRWKAPSKILHPCIYFTKQLIQNFQKERELVVFCDFHGHSRRKNIFMYGCHFSSYPEDTRLYPFLMSKICPFFVYNHCRFGNQKSKEATARIALFNELKIPAIYTMESSFCGNDQGPFANYHFSLDNLMQTGRDFCRTLFLHQNINLPKNLSQVLLNQVMLLYEQYRTDNETKELFQKDKETELMKSFHDKITTLKNDKIDISTKHIKKALLQVLLLTQDHILDGEATSSAGSDQAPSEDNLEPEEIDAVVPCGEDDATISKNLKKPKKENMQETATSISPLRRKNTMDEGKKRNSAFVNPAKRLSLLKAGNQKGKDGNNSGSKVQLDNSRKNTMDDNPKTDEEEKKSQGAEVADHNPENDDGQNAQKKKRKRNVESRDAWTQTDRSDYMIIKQRQKQKLAATQGNSMAKSQKFSKEEQIFYEQALQQQQQLNHYQQTLLNSNQNRSLEPVSTQSSVNLPLNKVKNISNQNQLSGSSSIGQNQAIPQKSNQQQYNQPLEQTYNPQYKLSSNSYNNQKNANQNPGSQGNYSRNSGTAKSSSKNHDQQNGMYQQNLLKTQQVEGAKHANEHNMGTPNIYLHFSNTQEIKDLNKIEYQSNKNQPNSTQKSQNIMKNQPNSTLPQIQTPNPILNKRKSSQYAGGVSSSQKVRVGSQDPSNIAHHIYGTSINEIASNHSTQRIVQKVFSNPNGIIQVDNASSGGSNQHWVASQSPYSKNLPPKPNSKTVKSDNNSSSALTKEIEDFSQAHQQQIKNVRILENAYIQQKMTQQEGQEDFPIVLEYDNIKIDPQRKSNSQNRQQTKGNFFVNPQTQTAELTPTMQYSNQHMTIPGKAKKSRSDVYGNTIIQSTGMQGHSIKKMIENSWKAVQQQQMSNSFYGPAVNHSLVQQQPPIFTQQSFVNGKLSAQGGPRPRTKNQQQHQQQQNMQFDQTQGVLPQHQLPSNSGKVKISIVNVHNEFNIQNNIIISNPQQQQPQKPSTFQKSHFSRSQPKKK